jgi:hypothetical protein
VSFDTDVDPELNLSVDDEGVVTGSVRIANHCAECGQELTEGLLDLEVDLSDAIREHRDEHTPKDFTGTDIPGHTTLELTDDGGSRTDELVKTDRRGKPITNFRYMKHLYGVEVEVTVTCECGETFTDKWRDSVQASAMESLV